MNLPYRMCQAVVKLFGTPAQMKKWGLEPEPNVCERLAALEANAKPEITVDRKTALVGWAGVRTDGTTFGATIKEDSEGQWTMTFNQPHPSGSGGWIYHGSGEENQSRDNPKITLVDGSDTSTGAQIMVTVDDNGTASDIFEDNDYSFTVYAECEMISQLYVNGVSGAEDGGNTDANSTVPTFPESASSKANYNFQDGPNTPFNVQVADSSGNSGVTGMWQLLIENRPYSSIPGLSNNGYTVSQSQNPDGTYNYLFAGTTPLNNFENFVITGGVVSPSGDSNQNAVSLYCEEQ